MLFQKLGYTDVKTKIMFIENKIAFYQIIGIDLLNIEDGTYYKLSYWKRDTDKYKMKILFSCYF